MIQVVFEPSNADLIALGIYLGILVVANAVMGSRWYR